MINGTTFTAVYGTAGSLQYSVGTVSNRDNPFQAASNFVNAVNAYNAAHPTTFTFTAQLFFGNWFVAYGYRRGSAGNNVSVSPSGLLPVLRLLRLAKLYVVVPEVVRRVRRRHRNNGRVRQHRRAEQSLFHLRFRTFHLFCLRHIDRERRIDHQFGEPLGGRQQAGVRGKQLQRNRICTF